MANLLRGGVSVGGGGATVGRITVLGVPEAIAKLTGVGKIARISLGVITRESAQHMAERAKANIHSVSGNLASGTYATQLGPYTWQVVSSSMEGDIAGKNDYEYADFVEFGTSKMEPRAYMTRAYEETRPETLAAVVALAAAIEAI